MNLKKVFVFIAVSGAIAVVNLGTLNVQSYIIISEDLCVMYNYMHGLSNVCRISNLPAADVSGPVLDEKSRRKMTFQTPTQ